MPVSEVLGIVALCVCCAIAVAHYMRLRVQDDRWLNAKPKSMQWATAGVISLFGAFIVAAFIVCCFFYYASGASLMVDAQKK